MQQQQQFNGFPGPYWQQPVYPQQQSQSVFPQPLPAANGAGYTPYHPGHYIPLGPSPAGFDPAAYQQEHPTPRPQQQQQKPKHRRAKTVAATPSTPAQPLKSALKKTNTFTAFPTTEHSSNVSRGPVLRPENTLHRIRTQSNSRRDGTGRILGDNSYAHHLFMSFHGFNELRLGNASTSALKEMQDTIWPLWPGGATSQVVNYTAIIKFFNDPWDMSGPNTDVAYKIIVNLFRLCAARGYSYQTSYNLTSTPQLVFQPTSCDDASNFFLGYLSNGDRKLTLVNAPDPINVGLNPRLCDILPPNVILDLGVSGDCQTVEIKKEAWRFGGSEGLSPKLFFMQVLRIISEFGYYLDACLPLYRRGHLGIRLRREILVFKGRTPI